MPAQEKYKLGNHYTEIKVKYQKTVTCKYIPTLSYFLETCCRHKNWVVLISQNIGHTWILHVQNKRLAIHFVEGFVVNDSIRELRRNNIDRIPVLCKVICGEHLTFSFTKLLKINHTQTTAKITHNNQKLKLNVISFAKVLSLPVLIYKY